MAQAHALKTMAHLGGWLVGLCIATYAWQLISEKTIWMFVFDAPGKCQTLVNE